MKKILALIPTAALMISIYGTAAAAPANSFTDVPRDHWAYESLQKLAAQGVIEGYNGRFDGEKSLSRYEMAEILARAMTKMDKADPKAQAEVKKLQAEFRQELRKLGVRVARLEKRIDKAKWTGEIRARYEHDEVDQVSSLNKTLGGTLRSRLMLEGLISKDWSYYARLENTQNLRTSTGEGSLVLNRAYVTGPLFNKATNVSIGRISYMPAYGIVVDNEFDGVQLSFGSDVIKTNLFYGRESLGMGHRVDPNGTQDAIQPRVLVHKDVAKYTASGSSDAARDTTMHGAEFIYSGLRNINVKFAHLSYEAKNFSANRYAPKLTVNELGFDTKIGDNFTVQVVSTNSNAPVDDRASVIGLTYKSYDTQIPNSFNVYGQYRKLGRFATWYTTFDTKPFAVATGYNDRTNVGGIKGWEFGTNYVLDKNILLNANYFDGENIDGVYQTDDTPWKEKVYRISLYWMF